MAIVTYTGGRPDHDVRAKLSEMDRARRARFCRGVAADYTHRRGCRMTLAIWDEWSYIFWLN